MSNIPEVMGSSADNVRRNFERLGSQYVIEIIDEIYEKQPMIVTELRKTVEFIEDKLLKEGMDKEIVENILNNVTYRVFGIIKSLYIQEEVNDLEFQHKLSIIQE